MKDYYSDEMTVLRGNQSREKIQQFKNEKDQKSFDQKHFTDTFSSMRLSQYKLTKYAREESPRMQIPQVGKQIDLEQQMQLKSKEILKLKMINQE